MRQLPLALMILVAGCQAMPTSQPATFPPVSGRASFDTFGVQATITEVASRATVSLIDTTTNDTISASVTDPTGAFVLRFNTGFMPVMSRVYHLEAIKGLAGNLPGHRAVRVRTLISYQNGTWTSMTSGGVIINPSTTALAIGGALKSQVAPETVSLASMLGSLGPGVTSYDCPDSGLSNADYQTLVGMVRDALNEDEDPVATIGLGTNGWQRVTP